MGTPAATISLLIAAGGLRAGTTTDVVVAVDVPRGWHVYWENPGQSGLPTEVTLTTDPTFVVSGPEWTAPTRFVTDGLTTYGYGERAAAVHRVAVPAQAEGWTSIEATGTWLLCKDVCVRGEGRVVSRARVRPPGPVRPHAARRDLPAPFAESGGSASFAEGALRFDVPGPGKKATKEQEQKMYPKSVPKMDVRPKVSSLSSCGKQNKENKK